MKILIVDDTPICLEVLHAILTKLNHEVVACNHPKAALLQFQSEAVIENHFDLVMTDFNMPEWSGLTLALQIKAACTSYYAPGYSLPIICLTGDNTWDVQAMNKRDGSPISLILAKPYGLQDIDEAIKTVIKQKAAGA